MPDQPKLVRGHMSPRNLERMQRLFAWLYGLFCRLEFHGKENLLAEGGFLLTANHLSRLDPPLVLSAMPSRHLALLGADNYRSNPLFRFVLESVDVIWVNRGATSPSTLKAAIQLLQEGAVFGIAPEGTRSRTHGLIRGKTGAAFLALATGAPVLPVALTNTDKVIANILRLRRTPVSVTFGRPFSLAEPGQRRRHDAERLEQATDEIMCRIAALLPPEYRGVYADHPRLKELLAGEAGELVPGMAQED